MASEVLMPKLGLTMTEGTVEARSRPQSQAVSAVPRQAGRFVLATPYARKLAVDKGYDLARIPGSGAKGSVTSKDVERYTPGPKTSPAAAKLAVDLGVDLTTIQANGRVMKADVLRAARRDAPAAAPEAEKRAPASSGNDLPPVKVDPLRRSIAANMSASWSISPRVTYVRPVDAAAMQDIRAKLQPGLAGRGIKLTYNHIIMKVVAKALMEFPDVNSSFSDNLLTRHIHANVGLAVAKGNGLLVPNVKRCEEKTLIQIAQETQELVEKTRAGKLDAADMTGGTFTVTSLGPYGVTSFTPIINQPELAILGVCDIVDTPVVRAGEIVIRPMMDLCLTADHRVIDGVMAAGFFSRVCQLLEEPCLLLA